MNEPNHDASDFELRVTDLAQVARPIAWSDDVLATNPVVNLTIRDIQLVGNVLSVTDAWAPALDAAFDMVIDRHLDIADFDSVSSVWALRTGEWTGHLGYPIPFRSSIDYSRCCDLRPYESDTRTQY